MIQLKISWLHLSDLHLGKDDYNENIVLETLFEDIKKQRQDKKISFDFIFITGDVTYSGQNQEFVLAKNFIDRLSRVASVSLDNIVVVPGNHDVNRKAVPFSAQNSISSLSNRNTVNHIIDDFEEMKTYLRPLENFQEFTNTFNWSETKNNGSPSFTINRKINNISVSVLALNSAWAAYGGKNEKGMLLVGEKQVSYALKNAEEPDLIISLIHHPFEWLKDFDNNDCKSRLERSVDYILTGHEHNINVFRQAYNGRAFEISAGATYFDRDYSNSYNIVVNDFLNGTATLYARRYSDKHGGKWVNDNTAFHENEDGIIEFPIEIKNAHIKSLEQVAIVDESPLHLLPSMHITDTKAFMEIIKQNQIIPSYDRAFNNKLTYFTYGKSFIPSKEHMFSRSNSNLPCCLIVDTSNLAPYFRVYPFDSGAYFKGYFNDYLEGNAPIDQFSIDNNSESILWYIKNYYLNNKNYLENKCVNDSNLTVKHNHQLLKLLNSQKYFDIESGAIEISTTHVHDLKNILKAVVVPDFLTDTILEMHPNIDVLSYNSSGLISPQMYIRILYERVYDYITAKDGLHKSDDPSIFISYSWDSDSHKKKVENFVRRLRSEGLSVKYDGDIALGERLPEFMENSITDSDYTVFICTPQYKNKADGRQGGAGYENSIITGEILEKKNEKKFIPVLFSGTWTESLPNWAKGKLGVNYTNVDNCENELQKLIVYLKEPDSTLNNFQL